MGFCGGGRDKVESVRAEHKWDYINLSDFNSSSCFTPLSYVVLYISLVISVAVYAVDLFTCVQLLLFDKWSGQIQPIVKLEVSRWIFAGCIMLSWVLLVYRWIRATRAMRSGGVAQSYLDPLAVRVQSVRMGQRGRGWRRFLIFAELTKSRKGADYVALFTYFSFEAWLRIIFAEGPRQAINAMTLMSVMQSDVIPTGAHAASAGNSPLTQFFINVKILAEGNQIRAAILFGMLFTLIIWVISALGLLLACILYIMFVWHHIPNQDGGLYKYCKRKINDRLQRIVDAKVKKALAKEDMKRARAEASPGKGSDFPTIKRQATLPVLDTNMDDKLPDMPMPSRQSTQTTLPEYAPRQLAEHDPLPFDLERQPTLPGVYSRPMPARSMTQSSQASYASNAPLIDSAAPIGCTPVGRSHSPGPISPPGYGPYSHDGHSPMGRSFMGTQHSQRSYFSGSEIVRQGRIPSPPTRQNPGMSNISSSSHSRPAPPIRQNTPFNYSSTALPAHHLSPRQNTRLHNHQMKERMIPIDPARQTAGASRFHDTGPNPLSLVSSDPQLTTNMSANNPSYGRRTPVEEFELQPRSPGHNQSRHAETSSRFVAYNPKLNRSDSQNMSSPTTMIPIRNFTTPNRQPQGEYFSQHPPPQRSGTAPVSTTTTYDDSIYGFYAAEDAQTSRPPIPVRAATAGPRGGR